MNVWILREGKFDLCVPMYTHIYIYIATLPRMLDTCMQDAYSLCMHACVCVYECACTYVDLQKQKYN